MFTRATAVLALCLAPLTALADPLTGSEWEPLEIAAAPFETAGDAFVRFEQDGVVFGNGGCNSCRGRYLVNGEAILFGPAASTMMACPGDIGQLEYLFLQTLDKARSFARAETDLTLSDAAGDVIMRLRQRDWD